MILSCSNLSKSYVGETLFTGASFNIEDKEKVAIVGENGCGKTTLMKIILGLESPDEGNVAKKSDIRIGYMAQNPEEEDDDKTVYEALLSAKDYMKEMEAELERLGDEIKNYDASDFKDGKEHELSGLMTRYETLTRNFEEDGGLTYNNEVLAVMKGLGFSLDADKKISTLSGGQKTRIALGKLLLLRPDILFLDEPTNHLDTETVIWLENYLKQYEKAILLISHDRYFIDKIASKIIDMDNKEVRVYKGNYTDFSAKKKEYLDARLKAYENDQRERKHDEEVIKKLKQFNREKSIKRAESREKLLEKREVIEKPVTDDERMRLQFKTALLSGNDVLSVTGLNKRFGDNIIFEDAGIMIKRGEHVGLVGANGTGKSTLLKIIDDLVPSDDGYIKIGTNVMIGYYDQEHHNLDPDKTIFDEISYEHPYLTGTEIRNMLSAFLFTGDDVFTKIGSLSGGERGRVSLAKLMLSDANFLLLDEPTNHLDIKSVEVLEDALNRYEGTVLFVSHDRYFLNRCAKRITELKDKKLTDYPGNYDYYLEKSSQTDADTETGYKENAEKNLSDADPKKNDWKKQKEEQARLRKLNNDIEKCEKEIAELEEKIKLTDEKMAEPEIATNVGKLNDLSKERNLMQERLDEVMDLWEKLSEQI